MADIQKIIETLTKQTEFYRYIRDDNLDIGSDCYDWTHGVYQGHVEAAELILAMVLKLAEEEDL